MSSLTDKIILISGGTQGLGAGIARAAAREGADVESARASVAAVVERHGRIAFPEGDR